MQFAKVTLVGKLTADAVLKRGGYGYLFSFSLVVNRPAKSKAGKDKVADFYECVYLLGRAVSDQTEESGDRYLSFLKRSLLKGASITVQGDLRQYRAPDLETNRTKLLKVDVWANCIAPHSYGDRREASSEKLSKDVVYSSIRNEPSRSELNRGHTQKSFYDPSHDDEVYRE